LPREAKALLALFSLSLLA